MLGTGFGAQRLATGAASLAGAAYTAYSSGMGFTPLGFAATGMMAINGVSLKSVGLSALAGGAYGAHWLYHGGLGDSIGSIIGNTIRAGVKGVDLGEIGRTFTASFGDGIDEGMKGLNFQKLVDTWYKEYGAVSIELFNKVITETSKVVTDIIRDNTQTILTRVVPLVALGTAVTVGTPLAIYYGYKRLVHNIGKPKLAQEIKNYNPLDRAYEIGVNILMASGSSMKTYYKWLFGTHLATQALTALTGLAYVAKNIYFEEPYGGRWATDFLGDSMCYAGHSLVGELQYAHRRCNLSAHNVLSYEAVTTATLAIAFAATAYRAGTDLYEYVKENWGVTRGKPIFNDSIRETVDDVIEATKNLQRNGGYFQNMILYGPGGTGKTMISKYIARNSGMNYIIMSGGDLAQYIKRGEHVTELVKIFDTAKNSAGATILFIDEAESLCRDRGKMNRDELLELLNSFLNQTGEPSRKVMLVLATNRLEDIDEAVLSRMDNKVFVGPPEFEQRKQILSMYASHFFTKLERRAFFHEEALNELSTKTDGLTGRALFKMLNALSTKQKCTKTNRLTQDLVNLVVDRFVKQELEVKEKREAARVAAA